MTYRHPIPYILLLVLVACSTISPAPTATPTHTAVPTATPALTATPLPEPTALPRVAELTRATNPAEQAFVSAIHAAPTVDTFDVYLERLAIATNLSFGQFTQPTGIVAGEYFLRVVPQRVRPDAGQVLYETKLNLQVGRSLLLVFTGTTDNLLMSAFPQSTEALDAGQSRVTMIHALPDAPPITVLQNGVPLTSPIPFGSAAYPIVMASGTQELTYRADNGVTINHTLELQDRFNYVLVLAGSVFDEENLRFIETRSRAPGRASIRAVNASAAITPVDVYLNDNLLAANLEYTRTGERQYGPAQVYTVAVYPAGADRSASEPLFSSQVVANNDDVISLLIIGSPEAPLLLPYRENLEPTAPDAARITFVNTRADIPRVRIETQSRILDEVGELGYSQQPRPIELGAGTYTFTWLQMENGSPKALVELAPDVQLEPGRSYLYLFTGRITDPPIILSDPVGLDPSLVPAVVEPSAPTPEGPTRVRFINAIKGSLPIDIALQGQPIIGELAYGSASILLPVPSNEYAVQVRQAGQVVLDDLINLEPATPYTVIISGFGTDPVELLLLDDSAVLTTGDSAHFRLINTTIFGELELALAVSRAESINTSTTIFSESPGSDIFRRSLAFGIDPVRNLDAVAGRSFSNPALAPLGPHDLHVIDTAVNMIAASIRQVDLKPGAHYDLIFFQNRDTIQVEGFAVRYTTD
jgi:hypothetical protein